MNEQAVIESVENTLDSAVETVVPEVVETVNAVRNNPVVLAAVGVVAAAAGAFAGYKFAQKKLELKFAALMAEEIEQTRRFYSEVVTKDQYPTPADAVQALIPEEEREGLAAHVDYHKVSRTVTVEDDGHVVVTGTEEIEVEELEGRREDPPTRNIFLNGQPLDDTFDFETEVAKRDETRPFVITEAEYMENDLEYTQMTLTWYEGDSVLCDEQDGTISDVDAIVGDENMSRFGAGSNDPNIVFIRNTEREQEYEVARHTGKYTKVVLDLDDEDNQSVRVRKFRGGDD